MEPPSLKRIWYEVATLGIELHSSDSFASYLMGNFFKSIQVFGLYWTVKSGQFIISDSTIFCTSAKMVGHSFQDIIGITFAGKTKPGKVWWLFYVECARKKILGDLAFLSKY